jgi:hypothetical protein
MADINTEDLKAKAQEALDGAGKAAADAAEAAKPMIDEAGKKVGEAFDAASKAAKPVLDEAGKKVGEAFDAASKAAKPVLDEAGKKVGEAFDAAKPVIDDVAAKVAPVVEGAAAAVAPVVDTVGAKANEFAKQTGLDKTFETVAHDAGTVAEAAKNRVEELTGRDLDGDGKVGAGTKGTDPAVEAEEAAEKVAADAKAIGEEAAKAAVDIATGAKNKVETMLNKDLDGDGKIG